MQNCTCLVDSLFWHGEFSSQLYQCDVLFSLSIAPPIQFISMWCLILPYSFMPSFIRMGSWNIVMFVTYEQLKRVMSNYSASSSTATSIDAAALSKAVTSVNATGQTQRYMWSGHQATLGVLLELVRVYAACSICYVQQVNLNFQLIVSIYIIDIYLLTAINVSAFESLYNLTEGCLTVQPGRIQNGDVTEGKRVW